MNKLNALIKALLLTKWFFVSSYHYVGVKWNYFTGVIPAWYRFIKLTYKDNLNE